MNKDYQTSSSVLPQWMQAFPERGTLPDSARRGRTKRNFILRSLTELNRRLVESLVTEEYSRRTGLLQGWDGRIKLLLVVGVLILIGVSRSIALLLGVWALTLVAMKLSRLPVWSLQKGIWGVIPLITLLVSLPATLNLVNPGVPLLVLHEFSAPVHWLGFDWPSTIYVSKQGSVAALFLFLRVGISLSLGVLLAATTPVARLLRSLRVLGVPVLFVMIMEMSYRYLMLLLGLSIEMFEARNLRTVGDMSLRTKQRQVASSMGALFIKSMDLSGEVYQAMVARAYTGEAVSFD